MLDLSLLLISVVLVLNLVSIGMCWVGFKALMGAEDHVTGGIQHFGIELATIKQYLEQLGELVPNVNLMQQHPLTALAELISTVRGEGLSSVGESIRNRLGQFAPEGIESDGEKEGASKTQV